MGMICHHHGSDSHHSSGSYHSTSSTSPLWRLLKIRSCDTMKQWACWVHWTKVSFVRWCDRSRWHHPSLDRVQSPNRRPTTWLNSRLTFSDWLSWLYSRRTTSARKSRIRLKRINRRSKAHSLKLIQMRRWEVNTLIMVRAKTRNIAPSIWKRRSMSSRNQNPALPTPHRSRTFCRA